MARVEPPPPGSLPERRARGRRTLRDAFSRKAARKLRARREGDRSVWFGLGMMGVVGWSVAVPAVLGIAAGIWLDNHDLTPDRISWTLTGLVVGIALGCVNAWFWVEREMGEDP